MKFTLYFFLCTLMCSTIQSCSNQEEIHTSNQNSIEQYYILGEIHNCLLDAVIESDGEWQTRGGNEEYDTINYDLLHSELISKININENISDEDKALWISTMDESKSLYSETYVKGLVGGYSAYEENSIDKSFISEQIDSVFKLGIIDIKEKKLLKELMGYIIDNEHGLITTQILNSKICMLKQRWDSYYGSQSTFIKEGEFSAQIIAVALKSTEWWMKNLNSEEASVDTIPILKIAPWVASDIAGAVIGAGTYVLDTHLCGGKLSWKNGAISVTSKAIIASCGVAAPLKKYILKILNPKIF